VELRGGEQQHRERRLDGERQRERQEPAGDHQKARRKYSAGPLPHERLMRGIALYGTRVAPLVREMLEVAPP
jgi:hypothetical protein